ncbi:MAG: ArnT family glycosyltransferase [Blastocatellia bacterium]
MRISGLPPNNEERLQRSYPIALVVLCAVVFFYGLGWLPFIGPDEPRYAQVAREMFASGDWVTPRLAGIHWFEKPALTYWLSGIGYWLFGENELGARFAVAVVASLGVLLLYAFGRRVRSARYGYLSAAALATCGMWPGFARGATFDLPLAVAMTLALISFFLWEEKAERRRLWALFAFALGVAVLAKGLVGVVMPLAIIAPYLLLTGRWRAVLNPRLLITGAIVFIATASLWYAPVIARHGREFINEFFIGHHFARYLTNKYRHPQPFYFFLLVVIAGSFPWTFFLLSNLWQSLRRGRELLEDRLRLFLLLWLIVPVIFFSFSGSKLPGYILPVFPAIALMIGEELDRWWDALPPEKWIGVLTALLMAAAGIGTIFVGRRDLGAADRDVWWMAATAIAVAGLYLVLLLVRGGRAATIFLPFGLCAIVVAAAHLIFPALGNRESLRPLAAIATQMARPGEQQVFFVNHDHGINFYATGLPRRDTKSELVTLFSADEIALLVQVSRSGSLLVVSKKRWVEGVTGSEKLTVEKLGEQNFNARCSPGCDWVLLRARRKEYVRE